MAESQVAAGSLLVFADDWGRHPSSCQHLVAELLPRLPVWWVNTIGMRRPQFDRITLKRGLEKLRPWFRRYRPTGEAHVRPTNLHVLNPKMWPWFSRRHDRWLNEQLLARAISPIVRSMPRPAIAVTTLPIAADLVGSLPLDRWVYYCVDDFGAWPGLDQRAMQEMEERLVRKVDLLVAASPHLQERLATMGRDSELLTHGVHLDHWRPGGEDSALPMLAGCERPLVVFWGILDRRMDVEFIRQLADDMTAGTIVLAGPIEHPDPELLKTPRVIHVPPLDYNQLPHLAAEAAVLVMPYADLPVTRAMQPLKLKEYLATGKPTVSSNLPAVRPWADCLDVAHTAEDFSALVRKRIALGADPEQLAAQQRLAAESWSAKAERFADLLFSAAPPSDHASPALPHVG